MGPLLRVGQRGPKHAGLIGKYLLEGLARNGILSDDDAALLGDAYRAYRVRAHRLTLQEQPAVVSDGEFRHFRDGVSRIWGALMGS